MANNVFANGREISCKKADGKSICAFPDVCMTPPENPATPPGVPVPYPNTGMAKDTTSGSKKVKISGQEVLLKNKSYFKKSTGDEAGSAAKKGVLTSVNKGKIYFTAWSMDVKYESLNVVRHFDLTTHNHGSVPGNTGAWLYIDSLSGPDKRTCKKDQKRIEKKCKPTKKKGKGRKARKVLDKTPGAWKEKYCKGLNFKPPNADNYDPKEIEKQLDDLLNVKEQLGKVLEEAKSIVVEKVKDWAIKKTGKVIAKSAIKGWLGPIGWVWTAYDAVSTGVEVSQMWDVVDQMQEDIDNLKKLPEKLEEIKKNGITPSSLADAQAVVAAANPCLRARKCMLVPFQKSRQSKKARDRNSGCCKGQTAHHLIPKSQFKEAQDCPGYNPKAAPCVCVEGTSHSRGGSHQAIHGVLEPKLKTSADSNGEMTYKKAKKAALDSHQKLFPHCSRACIAAQLDAYHKKACNRNDEDFKVRASSGKGSKVYKAPSKGALTL